MTQTQDLIINISRIAVTTQAMDAYEGRVALCRIHLDDAVRRGTVDENTPQGQPIMGQSCDFCLM